MQKNEQYNENFERNISEDLNSIPITEEKSEIDLRKEEEKRIELLRKKGFSSQEIADFVNRDVTLIKTSYQDRRPCFKEAIFNRKYIEAELFKKLQKISPNDIEAKNRVAVINFDLNGLKALNDLGGHSAGDRGLGIFAEILQGKKPAPKKKEPDAKKDGDLSEKKEENKSDPEKKNDLEENKEGTVWWLNSIGINTTPFTQGGDEFGILLSSDTVNIKELEAEIKSRFIKEIVTNEEARKLIVFDEKKVAELKKEKGIDVPENFEFKLGASIGISTLAEAEDDSWIGEGEKKESLKIKEVDSEFEIIRKLRNRMIVRSDKLAMENKELVKEKQVREFGVITLENGEKIEVGKELYTLYNIRSKDEIAKQKEFDEMKVKFECLKGKASNEELGECGAA